MNESIAKQVVASKTSAHGLDLTSDSGVQTVVTDLFGDGSIDIRFTANAVIDGMHYVGRLQMKKTTSMTVEQLGFPMKVSQLLLLLAKKNSGLFLVDNCINLGNNIFIVFPIKLEQFVRQMPNPVHMGGRQYMDGSIYQLLDCNGSAF